jgi:tetratricopeptide (TPR) repeat protein
LSEAALAEMADPIRRLQLAATRLGGSGAKVTLAETIALSLEGLTDKARYAFYALGAFAPMPATFSRAAAEVVTEAGGATLAQLAAVNLLERVDGSLALHQTLADVASVQAPNLDAAQQRHQNFYLNLTKEDPENWQRIEAAYPQIEWIWQNAKEDKYLLALIDAVSIYQKRRGLWQDSIAWQERGIQIAGHYNLPQEKGKLYGNIGFVYDKIGKRKEAIRYYNQALQIMKKMGDQSGQANTLNDIGFNYYLLHEHEKALEHYNQALLIMEEEKDRSMVASILTNIGLVHGRKWEFEKASANYEKALLITEEPQDRKGLWAALIDTGLGYFSLGNGEKALELFNRALPIIEELGVRASIAITLSNIGSVYKTQGELETSLENYSRALSITTIIGDREFERDTRYSIVEIFRSQDRFNDALEQLEQIIALDRFLSHPNLESDLALLDEIKDAVAVQGGS